MGWGWEAERDGGRREGGREGVMNVAGRSEMRRESG